MAKTIVGAGTKKRTDGVSCRWFCTECWPTVWFTHSHSMVEHYKQLHAGSVDALLDLYKWAGKTWSPKMDGLCEAVRSAMQLLRDELAGGVGGAR